MIHLRRPFQLFLWLGLPSNHRASLVGILSIVLVTVLLLNARTYGVTLWLRSLSSPWLLWKKSCSQVPMLTVGGRMTTPEYPVEDAAEIVDTLVDLQAGGHHTPSSCWPESKVAVIIPYRNRDKHLNVLLQVLLPMLIRQHLYFTIIVVEQVSNNTFNKGILFNAGFLQALNMDNFDCFILHDVDMIPMDDRNMYMCNDTGPVHLASAINKFNYGTLYPGLFGGVVAFTRDQYQLINGASNMYFGWGAEDDDLRDRARRKNLTLLRRSPKFGVYDMIVHHKDNGWEMNEDRLQVFGMRYARQDIDGLNSAIYNVTTIRFYPAYTWIGVSINRTRIEETVPKDLRRGSSDGMDYQDAIFVIID